VILASCFSIGRAGWHGCFRDIIEQRIRRSAFTSVANPDSAINDYIAVHQPLSGSHRQMSCPFHVGRVCFGETWTESFDTSPATREGG
jgi:hypothetical protein